MAKSHNFNTVNNQSKNESLSFAEIVKELFLNEIKKMPDQIEKTEPLALLDYEKEVKIKKESLSQFLSNNKIKIKPEALVKSPRPRFYRTTSKRKIFESKDKFYFLFADESYPTRKDFFRPSLLEPEEHSKIYDYLCNLINSPGHIFLGRILNFVIIRGNYQEFSVIFNVHKINAEIVRKFKTICEKLQKLDLNIVSSFMYYDPSRSEYYFESERPEKEVTFKKFFGPEFLFLKAGGKKLSYHPTSFSQVNESIIPLLLNKIELLLEPQEHQHFYDLYCGYGLFACNYASKYKEVTGVEVAGESIKSASINAKHAAPGSKTRFVARKITEESLEQILPVKIKNEEVFLLDPPRNGTGDGVIDLIAQRNPAKVIHIFCSVDEIPGALKEWGNNGYTAKSVTPFDMFPGSPNLEVIVLLTKER